MVEVKMKIISRKSKAAKAFIDGEIEALLHQQGFYPNQVGIEAGLGDWLESGWEALKKIYNEPEDASDLEYLKKQVLLVDEIIDKTMKENREWHTHTTDSALSPELRKSLLSLRKVINGTKSLWFANEDDFNRFDRLLRSFAEDIDFSDIFETEIQELTQEFESSLDRKVLDKLIEVESILQDLHQTMVDYRLALTDLGNKALSKSKQPDRTKRIKLLHFLISLVRDLKTGELLELRMDLDMDLKRLKSIMERREEKLKRREKKRKLKQKEKKKQQIKKLIFNPG